MKRFINGVFLLTIISAASVRAAEFRLMSAESDRGYRALLPKIEDEKIEQILHDPKTILYTETEMPRAYQFRGELHSPTYNISAGAAENSKGNGRGGNANVEFPWVRPAGTDNSPNVGSFKFLHVPQMPDGRLWPVVWYQKALGGDSANVYAWIFPVGTVVGEVLYMVEDGPGYVFEIRTRTRLADKWAVEVYRPFPTASSLARRLEEIDPEMKPDSAAFKMVSYLRSRHPFSLLQVVDTQPDQAVFRQQAWIDRLPSLPKDTVKKLLTTTAFKSSAGESWNDTHRAGGWVHAPTSDDAFNIVPKGFNAAFIEVSSDSCLRCHRSTNVSARVFNGSRDWYGHVRGSDGIFSFHPFDPTRISYNGFGAGVGLRQSLVSAGIVDRYDRAKHPIDRYTSLPTLAE